MGIRDRISLQVLLIQVPGSRLSDDLLSDIHSFSFISNVVQGQLVAGFPAFDSCCL